MKTLRYLAGFVPFLVVSYVVVIVSAPLFLAAIYHGLTQPT